jgi:ATP-dependent metalloprotease FtsH
MRAGRLFDLRLLRQFNKLHGPQALEGASSSTGTDWKRQRFGRNAALFRSIFAKQRSEHFSCFGGATNCTRIENFSIIWRGRAASLHEYRGFGRFERGSSALPEKHEPRTGVDAQEEGKRGSREEKKWDSSDRGTSQKVDSKEAGSEIPNGEPKQPFDLSWVFQLLLAGGLFYALNMGNSGNGATTEAGLRREINFQQFVRDLLEPGLVDHVEVVNRQTAYVYLKSSHNVEKLSEARPHEGGTELEGSAGRRSVDDHGSIWDKEDQPLETANHQTGYRSRPTPRHLQRQYDSARSQGDNLKIARPGVVYFFTIGSVESFEQKMEQVEKTLGIEAVPVIYRSDDIGVFGELLKLMPTLVILGLGYMLFRNSVSTLSGPGGAARNIFQVGKANPTIIKKGAKSSERVSFADVAGLDEAKTEVMELVDFLRDPKKYRDLGAKIPKGALLVGPPGTGKTLLAKAVAGEADVPFFSMSGSDFIEMFVGIGPSRVRDLFAQARQNAPCIVFIDEIDAVGRARGRGGFGGGNDERENTLNALLVEMDGFSSQEGIVVLAGTNRVDILDRALLRPGRFDRRINIDKPDIRGRFEIYKVHLRKIRLASSAGTIDDVAKRLATLTPGFAGADIANSCNEAALIAARANKETVGLEDFESAIDRVIGGLEKKNLAVLPEEREIVAHHEAGHAVASWFAKHADPLLKVSIVPRGSAALGFAQYLPRDRFLQTREELEDFLIVALGGRTAEKLVFGRITTGAQDDLERVTRIVYAAITRFGMSNRVGTISFGSETDGEAQFQKPFSEETAEIIDAEARAMVDQAYARCDELLRAHLDELKNLARTLLSKEIVREDDLVAILGPRPFGKPVDYDSVVSAFENARRTRNHGDAAQPEKPGGTGDSGEAVQKPAGNSDSQENERRRGSDGIPPGLMPELA